MPASACALSGGSPYLGLCYTAKYSTRQVKGAMGLGLHDVAVLLLMLLVPLASKGLGRVAMGCTGRQHDGSSRENVRPHVEAVSSSRSACAKQGDVSSRMHTTGKEAQAAGRAQLSQAS